MDGNKNSLKITHCLSSLFTIRAPCSAGAWAGCWQINALTGDIKIFWPGLDHEIMRYDARSESVEVCNDVQQQFID